jgi:hypothetical protein
MKSIGVIVFIVVLVLNLRQAAPGQGIVGADRVEIRDGKKLIGIVGDQEYPIADIDRIESKPGGELVSVVVNGKEYKMVHVKGQEYELAEDKSVRDSTKVPELKSRVLVQSTTGSIKAPPQSWWFSTYTIAAIGSLAGLMLAATGVAAFYRRKKEVVTLAHDYHALDEDSPLPPTKRLSPPSQ